MHYDLTSIIWHQIKAMLQVIEVTQGDGQCINVVLLSPTLNNQFSMQFKLYGHPTKIPLWLQRVYARR